MAVLASLSPTGPRNRLGSQSWRSIILMAVIVGALCATGLILLSAAVPGHYVTTGAGGSGVFGWSTGLLALTLGIRHAFDPDHIAAIDNTTRKLSAGGRRPLAVGFFFSLGHSTIVFLMALLLGLGVAAFNVQVENKGSVLHRITGIIGPTVSGTFLVVIATINIMVTVAIVRAFRKMRKGELDSSLIEAQLSKRGLLTRVFGGLAHRIDASWKIYPLGVLFGLGFDTATEVTLLVLSGAAVLGGLPWWAVLSLPLLFAAGMCFFDSLDGILMALAYGWAFLAPARKIYYNVVITVMSVVIALIIGMVELCSVLADNLGWHNPFLAWFDTLDFLGCAIVGTLLATWLVALLVWKVGRFDQKLAILT